MEVHHHPKVEKKNFKEYLFEGLMIFLAVTLGFFAETIRENISENSKAGELAKSLYQEVYSDSVQIQKVMDTRVRKEEEIIYFRKYVSDSGIIHVSPQFYASFAWAFLITAAISFEPNDGVLDQLRNSGTLRYFKQMDLQNKIGELSVDIAKVRGRNDQEYNYVTLYVRPFLLKFFDFNWIDSVTQHGKIPMKEALRSNDLSFSVQGEILNQQEFKRQEAENLAYYYLVMMRSTRQNQYADYIAANHELLDLLRKEYDVKK
jgi:hypothetical protein